jgi:indolepyruvate ferredoxin oxidoreductase
MAPPILTGEPTAGRPRKREFGAWMLPLLRVLARLRMLRGTWLDPFGRNAERRMERELVKEYEALTERVAFALAPANHQQAVGILSAADKIRGFGPIKTEAVHSYRDLVKDLEQRFCNDDPDAALQMAHR